MAAGRSAAPGSMPGAAGAASTPDAAATPSQDPVAAVAGKVVQLTETYGGDGAPVPPFTDFFIPEPELSRLRGLGIVIDADAPAVVAMSSLLTPAENGTVDDDDEDEDDDE